MTLRRRRRRRRMRRTLMHIFICRGLMLIMWIQFYMRWASGWSGRCIDPFTWIIFSLTPRSQQNSPRVWWQHMNLQSFTPPD